MFCTSCGKKLPDGAKFCTNCGQPVGSHVGEPTKPAEEMSESTVSYLDGELQELTAPSPMAENLESAVQPALAEDAEPAEPAADLPLKEIPEPESPAAEMRPAITKETLSEEKFSESAVRPPVIRVPEPESPPAKMQPAVTEETLSEGEFSESAVQPPVMNMPEPSAGTSGGWHAEGVPSSFALPQRKGFKKLYIILAAVFVVIVASGGLILKWYTSPAQKFSRAVKQADYAAASTQYVRMSSQEQDAALNQLANLAWEAVQDYGTGGATYEEVDEWLDGLTAFYFPQLEGYAPEIFDMLENLHTAEEHIEKAEAAESGGDLPTALSEYEAGLAASSELADDLGPDPEELNAKIQNIEQKYKSEIIEQAEALADQADFSGAAALLRESQSVLGSDEEIQSLLKEYEDQQTEADISALLEAAETKAKGGDYPEAISVLQNAQITESRITSKLSEYKTAYEKQVLAEAADLAEAKEYQEAVAHLTSVTTVLGDTDMLLAKIKEYEDCFPVSLLDMDYYSKDQYVSINEGIYDEDVLGNIYSGYILYPSGSGLNTEQASKEEDGEIEYLLNGKYNTLSGTLYLPYNSRAVENPNISSLFKVYGDGKLLYTAPDFRKGVTDPVGFSVDISGVKVLKIAILGIWFESIGWVGYYDKEPMICAADLAVSKG